MGHSQGADLQAGDSSRETLRGAHRSTDDGSGRVAAATGGLDFEAFFAHSPNAYMVLDRDLRFIAANDAYLKAVGGVRREEILGRRVFEAFPSNPDDPDDIGVRHLRSSLEKVLKTRAEDHLAAVPYSVQIRTAEGVVTEERYWSATHVPILDEQGEVSCILQHTVDITELQVMKRALRAAEVAGAREFALEQVEQGVFRRARKVQEANDTLEMERRQLRKLFEQAPGFIAVVSGPSHIFRLVNEAYYGVVGHRQVLGKSVREALPEVAEQGFLDLLDQVYTTAEPFVGRGVRILLERTPGAPLDELFVDFVYQPIIEPDGSVSGIFAQGHDVTDMVRAQEELRLINSTLEERVRQRTEELEVRNRELQEFAYIASHDLQEPLRKIHSFSDLLVVEAAETFGEDAHAYVERIQHAAVRMSTLISDLLTYSRVQMPGEPFRPVDLNRIVEEVLVDLEATVREANAEVTVEELPSVEADATQLRQLLQNLIGNAIKYRHPGASPRVRVSGRISDERASPDGCSPLAILEVADDGIGFDEKYLNRIFRPFQRLHGRGSYEGTGMGLAICRRIVERHGGSITAQSTPGQGSTFVVRLPVRQSQAADTE